MRSFSLAGPLLAAACLVSPALAQELQINQRLTTPTAQADAYAGMTVGRLILVLGLSLQGVPPSELRGEALARRLQALGEPGRRSRHPVTPVAPPAPLLARQSVADPPPMPVAAVMSAPADAAVLPAPVLPAPALPAAILPAPVLPTGVRPEPATAH
ncbi:MAG TPA: hypothetical protein VGB82_12830 [Alphaproteobacteria bacterium]